MQKMAGLSNKVVVLDVGYKYTKLGVGGDTHPRCIIPTTFRDPMTGSVKSVFSYNNEEELYNNFVEFLHFLYFKKILISPKDTKVIIVDSLLSVIQIKETMAKVFFCHLQIQSLLTVPSHMVAVYTLGVPSALVLDIGYQEACVVPVYEGCPMLLAYEAQPLAGQAIEKNIRKLLIEDCKTNDPSKVAVIENLSDKIIEDIKVRLCFVTTLDRALKIESKKQDQHPPSADYNIAGRDVLKISGKVRETACEVLFQLDADEISLTTMLLNSLAKCCLDVRKTLAENILLIGGTASTRGIKTRLLSELKYYVKSAKYKNKLFVNNFKIHTAPSQENYTAWLGGALVGATELVNWQSVTNEDYKRQKDMPDWANLKYNIKLGEKQA